jgi:CCR4-NOT transcription complex subunit 11
MLISIDLPPIVAHNPTIATPLLISLLTHPPSDASGAYLDVLAQLPPTLPTFDVFGRLLRDTTPVMDSITGRNVTVADVVRMEVLGPFIHQCILWIDHFEREEREGLISDDRFAKAVQNVLGFIYLPVSQLLTSGNLALPFL